MSDFDNDIFFDEEEKEEDLEELISEDDFDEDFDEKQESKTLRERCIPAPKSLSVGARQKSGRSS